MAVNLGPLSPLQSAALSDWFHPSSGKSEVRIRLCPPKKGKKFCMRTRTHRVGNKLFHCPKELDVQAGKWLGKCVFCDAYNAAWQQAQNNSSIPGLGGSPGPAFQALKPVERYYFNIIVREEQERGVLKWSCGRTLYTVITEGIVGNPKNPLIKPLGDVTDPKTGHDLFVKCNQVAAGGNMFPDYSASQFLPSTPLGTAKQVKEWMKNLHDLESLRVLHTEIEMKDYLAEHLGISGEIARAKKRVFRDITEPFEPGW